MNRNELIQRITEAGFPYSSDMLAKLDCFERLLDSEREACAKICDKKAEEWFEMQGWLDDFANEIANDIRARNRQ